METVKIPEERVKALVGEKGKTKALIERKCNVKLAIGSEGDVEITGETADEFFAKDVIKAIGRGFSPHDALRIMTNDLQLCIINLREYLKNDSGMKRIKARVIGENGKMKKEIESATDSVLSVYGYTVGIIAPLDTIEYAKSAVMKIIDGARLQSVSGYLSRMRKQILFERLR